jgi:hypothetical protein
MASLTEGGAPTAELPRLPAQVITRKIVLPPVPAGPAGEAGTGVSERRLLAILLTIAGTTFLMAIRLRLHFVPSGDEPAYLIISQTLQKYHSVDVTRDYLNQDYRSFYPYAKLFAHVVQAPNGRPEPLHSLGGPLLWLIPFMILGRLGACLFIGLVSLLTVANIYLFLRERGIEVWYAFFVTLIMAVATPLYVYASMTFVEPIGALLILYAVRVLLAQRLSAGRLLVAGLALGYLPWVHVRFLLFTLIIGGFFGYRLAREHARAWRAYLPFAVPVLGLLVLLEVYNLVEWGSFNPASGLTSNGNGPFQIPLPVGFVNMMFDGQHGLITNFPIFLLVLPGLLLSLHRAHLRLHAVVLAVLAPYLVMICTFEIWWAGYSPPARYLDVVLPLLSFYIAYTLQRIDSIVLTCGTLVVALATYALSLTSDIFPGYRFRDREGVNLAMRKLTQMFGGNRIMHHLPDAFAPGGEYRRFALWFAASVLVGVALWLIGRWRAIAGRGRPGGLARLLARF